MGWHTYWEPGQPLNGEEKWYPVPKYEGVYEISTFGRVRRILGGKGTRPGTHSGRVLAMSPNHKGYGTVRLSLKGKPKTFNVHMIVARVFLGRGPSDRYGPYQVHHKDNNGMNPRADNLEYKTDKENAEEKWQRARRGEDPYEG